MTRASFHTLILAAVMTVAPAAAYELRFSPHPAYVDQARVVVTLDYYDPWACPTSLHRLQSPNATTFRYELQDQPCPPGAGPYHSVSATLPRLPVGTYTVELHEQVVWRPDAYLTASFDVFAPTLCQPWETVLCLRAGRFSVAVDWQDFAGEYGAGHPVPIDPAQPFASDTGMFWFFDPGNLELMVKVLDGCALNGRFWVFLSPASTVGYDVTVTDLETGVVRVYSNEAGNVPALTADTDAFPCS